VGAQKKEPSLRQRRSRAGWRWGPLLYNVDHRRVRPRFTESFESSLVPQSSDASSTASAAGARLIKKYPNRRLYDTTTSAYITLAEIKALVLQAQSFVVRDAKTNEDLTRSILLQIILEEETGGVPLFTEQMLAQFIRFYGHGMQGVLGTYLEKNMQVFMEMQQRMQDQAQAWSPEAWQQLMAGTPAVNEWMNSYLDQSRSAMQQLQDNLQAQSETMWAAMGLKRK
jgi:polyhydroxyalkanoate synthesis repressor PhaR